MCISGSRWMSGRAVCGKPAIVSAAKSSLANRHSSEAYPLALAAWSRPVAAARADDARDQPPLTSIQGRAPG